MNRLILSLVLGWFCRPAAPPAPPAVPATAPTVARSVSPAKYSRPPVAPHMARVARGAVRAARQKHGGGKVLHRFRFADGTEVEFQDRPRAGQERAQRARVVARGGTQRAAVEPESTFAAAGRTLGLSAEAIEALRFVSRHEGGFDAINTWDGARFSWGFIQFAGGYGLRPALAYLKATSPGLFQQLLGKYGVDVVPGEGGSPEPVLVDAKSGQVLRGSAAEQAYGDDPLLIALFIRAGKVREVKQRQIEAAIRDYAIPALTATCEGVRLSDVLRSPRGLAALIDRQVHEGNVLRLEWALEHARIVNRVSQPRDWPRLETQVLDLAIRDADARVNIAKLVECAAAELDRAACAASAGDAVYVPGGPTLAAAHAALQRALWEADYRMVVSYRRDVTHTGLVSALMSTAPGRLSPGSPQDMSAQLTTAAASLRELVSRFRWESATRDRLSDIRNSTMPGPEGMKREA